MANRTYPFAERIKNVDGEAINDILKASADPSIISLAGGNPASELFPGKELAEIAYDLLTNEPALTLQYSVAQGYAPLRDAVLKMIAERDNIIPNGDDIIITSGSQQGMDFAAKCLLNEGDKVIVENPSFLGALGCFMGYGAQLVGVDMENDGVNVAHLKQTLETTDGVKLLYTIPNFQNPTGITMSTEKRKEVYRLCAEHNVLIVEDNPYGELTFSGEKKPSLKSMDTEGIVIYCGSFSKILAPGIRVGYIVAPAPIVKRMAEAKQANDTHSPMITQLMVYEYLRRHDIGENIQRMRDLYSRKCRLMLDEADAFFPAAVTHTTPGGGLFVWCDMGGDYDTIAVYKECIGHKVAFVPGAPFMADPSKRCSAFRLNYSTMPDEKIAEGMRILGNALKKIMA
ncbi:MAG: PLP-dependent aminotransferase family protein [Clostridia bacterium]|nr:PLP-dependent aminotransferase family protein [Clostridia bacterium]